jgi:hypothetical protein
MRVMKESSYFDSFRRIVAKFHLRFESFLVR